MVGEGVWEGLEMKAWKYREETSQYFLKTSRKEHGWAENR